MAIAKAYCKCATCGTEFEVRKSCYNSRDARRFEEWAEANITECSDCEKVRLDAEHAAENAKATEAAKEMGYPELVGTEKQIAWANTIREKVISSLREHYLDEERLRRYPQSRFVYTFLHDFLLERKQAGWWIENSFMTGDIVAIHQTVRRLAAQTYDRYNELAEAVKAGRMSAEQALAELSKKPEQPEEKKEEPEKPVRPEAVPETRKHDGSADICVDGDTVTAMYDKDDTFRSIVKGMGFSWGIGWNLKAGEKTGTVADIVAELGSKLLNNGFAVRFDSKDLMDKAVSGDYTPMCRRWIQSHSKGFYITWPREDDLYYEVKSIPCAVYSSPGFIVPERSWDAVADFAAKYGYRLTAKAQEKMDALSGATRSVAPAPVRKPEYNETNVLDSSREVIEDLKD